MSNFLSGLAVIFSVTAGLFSGFAAFQVFKVEQKVETSSSTVADLEKTQTSLVQNNPAVSAPSNASSTPANIASPANNVGIQPGQFVQPTLGNLGRIELLGVKRIQNPKTGTRNVVNVLYRVYRLAEKPGPKSLISISQTTARNPDTSEVYKAYGERKFAEGGSVLLTLVKKDIPEDGYVWLKVPEGVNALDIYIPETQAFKNVPIAN
ncbi:MAG: hypothetical protein KME35_10135 [Aphanocapsa sp. GSE-SYN-MK-11-07L]|jgi:hypothetical protein|nr:hypothetical protein [Aphanocapsa sp. GSE-SYN-MK-11-07L]